MLTLAGSKGARTVIKFLHLHLLANWWLRRFPVVWTVPGSTIKYRASRVDSLALAAEMFEADAVYSTSGLPRTVQTFADLGCNVGYFACWLLARFKGAQLKGIMVDASAEAVEDARWLVSANHLTKVHVLHGLAGMGATEKTATFYLHAAAVNSTAVPPPGALREAFTWRATQVPCLSIEHNWERLIGDVPCDLLKVDIEGSEADFFRNETAFLKRVRTILVEWHKWSVSLGQVEKILAEQDFALTLVLQENSKCGTAVFWRKAA